MDQLEDRWVPSLLPGPEFLVDSAPSPAAAIVVASAPDGRSIVVSTNLSTSQVNAQLYNADGSPSGTAFDVNQGTVKLSFPTDLAVAMDAQGAFVVTWNGMPTGSTADTMYARRYDATGTALGSAFQVTPDSFGHSALAVDPAGDFVIAWNQLDSSGSIGIFAQRYDNTGTSQGSEFQVSRFATGKQDYPAAAMDGAGDFVLSWTSYGQDGSHGGVFARRFTAAGAALGDEFQVNQYTQVSQWIPSAGMDAAGDFVISWSSEYQPDASGHNIFARRYDATGAPVGGEFQVSQCLAGLKMSSHVAMNASGEFVIGWTNPGTPPFVNTAYYTPPTYENGVAPAAYARVYNIQGQDVSGEFQVNLAGTGSLGGVAIDGQGDLLFGYLLGFGQAPSTAYTRRYAEGAVGYSYGPAPGALTLTAPSGQTTFAYSQHIGIGMNFTLTLNGVSQTYNSSAVSSITVSAPGTGNVAVLATNDIYQGVVRLPYQPNPGTFETSEIVSLGQGGGHIYKYDANGSTYVFLRMTGFATAYASLGVADQGQLLASYGVQNTFVSAGSYSYLSSPGSFYHISGSPYVYAYAAGPSDVAYHYDGSAASTFVVSGTAYSYVFGTDNGLAFCNMAVGFRFNEAIAQHPGQDSAFFYDSPANDVFVGGAGLSYMYSTDAGGNLTEYDSAMGFAQVYANSYLGGVDYAYVYDALHNHVSGFNRLT